MTEDMLSKLVNEEARNFIVIYRKQDRRDVRMNFTSSAFGLTLMLSGKKNVSAISRLIPNIQVLDTWKQIARTCLVKTCT